MFNGDVLQFCAPAGATPSLRILHVFGLAKRPMHARGVTGSRDGQGFELALLQSQVNVVECDASVQGVYQGHAVQYGALLPGR